MADSPPTRRRQYRSLSVIAPPSRPFATVETMATASSSVFREIAILVTALHSASILRLSSTKQNGQDSGRDLDTPGLTFYANMETGARGHSLRREEMSKNHQDRSGQPTRWSVMEGEPATNSGAGVARTEAGVRWQTPAVTNLNTMPSIKRFMGRHSTCSEATATG
jgi:hypothetical protein